ncbi:MAG: hypothetical protein JOZ75_03780 [Candidatus Dormibacteraeota bacterium]|nr:hypothetical protein [Candidatus Dormibacteraeota bacterium]
MADLKDEIAGMGYDRLVINGTRVSGAVPGKLVQTVINLSRGDSDEKRA